MSAPLAMFDAEHLREIEYAVRGYSTEDLRKRSAQAYPGAWDRVMAFITAWDSHRVTVQESDGVPLLYDDLLTICNVRMNEQEGAETDA